MDDKKIFETEACGLFELVGATAFAEKNSLLFNDDERRKVFGNRAAELIRETCDFATVIPKLAEIIAAE